MYLIAQTRHNLYDRSICCCRGRGRRTSAKLLHASVTIWRHVGVARQQSTFCNFCTYHERREAHFFASARTARNISSQQIPIVLQQYSKLKRKRI